MKRTILMLIATLSLLCCRQSDKDFKIVVLGEDVKNDAVSLSMEEVELDGLLETARNYFVFNDSVLTVINDGNSGKPFIQFYNINNLSLIYQAIYKGNGPGELLSVICKNSGDYLLIDGSMNKRYARVNVGDYLQDPAHAIKYHDYSFDVQNLDLWNDSMFIVGNTYCFHSKRMNIHQDVPRLLILDGKTTIHYESLLSAISICGGRIALKPDHSRILFASSQQPFIEVYDSDLNLLKTIEGLDDYDFEYDVRQGFIQRSNTSAITYKQTCYDDTAVYYAYEGSITKLDLSGGGLKIEQPDYSTLKTYILKFDWDGNLQKSYYISGVNVRSMSMDSYGNMFIGCLKDGVEKMYKVRL